MKHNYTDEMLQDAIDAACGATAKEHSPTGGALTLNRNAYPSSWISENTARLALARELLERLPEPTPPVSADGKTPGHIAYESFINGSDSWTPKVGDTVRLKSGGPVMTVAAFRLNGDVVCRWFDVANPRVKDFEEATIKPATKEEQP
jgi:uncharacterized protein YodC (DUF2158 family)